MTHAPRASVDVPAGVVEAIAAATTRSDGEVFVAYRDLGDGASWDVRGDTVVHAASTMKVPVMVALHRRAFEGRFDLEAPMNVHNGFSSIVDGSPYTLDPADDSDAGLYDRVGESLPASELCRRMIVRSSNLATNLLVDELGADQIQRTIEGLGVRHMRVLRGVEDGKAYRAGLSNTATASDLRELLTAIAEGVAVSPEHSDAMLETLAAQEFSELIPAGLPEGIRVAHKTGSITGILHDAAIVMPEGVPPYVLVILTRDFADSKDAADAIREVTRRVHASREQEAAAGAPRSTQ
ncbi:Beta-lactamase 1 precursor [Planctomycetes bacterium Poly30]|uniref:beta-lactamase n=2 Tax=Saltatorellus ferox TaxID=2528018 RepID=A0A518EQL6_9BACT|nr:Beta-lactamase 1 precursor [Planctomycetes bacterium Poly30]